MTSELSSAIVATAILMAAAAAQTGGLHVADKKAALSPSTTAKPDMTLTQNRGYVVIPMRITWMQQGKKGGEAADFVVVPAKEGAEWRITSWTWTRR